MGGMGLEPSRVPGAGNEDVVTMGGFRQRSGRLREPHRPGEGQDLARNFRILHARMISSPPDSVRGKGESIRTSSAESRAGCARWMPAMLLECFRIGCGQEAGRVPPCSRDQVIAGLARMSHFCDNSASGKWIAACLHLPPRGTGSPRRHVNKTGKDAPCHSINPPPHAANSKPGPDDSNRSGGCDGCASAAGRKTGWR